MTKRVYDEVGATRIAGGGIEPPTDLPRYSTVLCDGMCDRFGGYMRLTRNDPANLPHVVRNRAIPQTGSAMNTGIFLDVLAWYSR